MAVGLVEDFGSGFFESRCKDDGSSLVVLTSVVALVSEVVFESVSLLDSGDATAFEAGAGDASKLFAGDSAAGEITTAVDLREL